MNRFVCKPWLQPVDIVYAYVQYWENNVFGRIFLFSKLTFTRTGSIESDNRLNEFFTGSFIGVQSVVGSIVWAIRRLKNPRFREMSARGYALRSVCLQPFFSFIADSYETFLYRIMIIRHIIVYQYSTGNLVGLNQVYWSGFLSRNVEMFNY